MKLPRRAARIVAFTTTAVVALGAAAVAQEAVPVTVAVVNGMRGLTVTGVNTGGTAPLGTPSLAFGANATQAPFGLVVTDLLYDRKGYTVDAQLSNLYKLGASGVSCDASIPSAAFNVTYATKPSVTDIKAVLDPVLTFHDADLNEDLGGLNTLLTDAVAALGTTLTVTVDNVDAIIQEVATTTALMAISDGSAAAFTDASEHPDCQGSGANTPTTVPLQTGAPTTLDASQLTALRNSLFNAADANTSATLTAAETVTAGLLPTGSDQPGGDLYEATKAEILLVLQANSLDGLVSATELETITGRVVTDLLAAATDLVTSLIGQSGVYPNLPILNLDRTKDGDPTTGTYHGVMTVTLTDGA